MKNKLKISGGIILLCLAYWCCVCGIVEDMLNLTYAKHSITFTGLMVDTYDGLFEYVVLLIIGILYVRMEGKLKAEGEAIQHNLRKFCLILWGITNIVLGILARVYMDIVYMSEDNWYKADNWYKVDKYSTQYKFFWVYIVFMVVIAPIILYVVKSIKEGKYKVSLQDNEVIENKEDKENNENSEDDKNSKDNKDIEDDENSEDNKNKEDDDNVEDNENIKDTVNTEDLNEEDIKEDVSVGISNIADVKKILNKFALKASIITLVVWGLCFIADLIHNLTYTFVVSMLLTTVAMIIPFICAIIFIKKEKHISEKYSVSGTKLFYRAWWVMCLEYYVIGTILSVLYKTCLKYRINDDYGTFAMETIILYSVFIWLLRVIVNIIRYSKKIKEDEILSNSILNKICKNKVLKYIVMILCIIVMIVVAFMIFIDIVYFSFMSL